MKCLSTVVSRMVWNTGKAASLLITAVSLSACVALGLNEPWDDDDTPDYTLISQNLVNSLAQLPHLNPLMATVQIDEPQSTFAQHIEQELGERGYKLAPVSEEAAQNLVKASTTQIVTPTVGKQNLYILSIGDVSVERAYDTVAGKTVPVSELVVKGVEQRNVQLNDGIFEVPDSPFSTVAYQPLDDSLVKKEYSSSGDVVKFEPKVVAALPAPDLQSGASVTGAAVKKNMYDDFISNYSDVFEEYEEIERATLIFPNDSLRIGDNNKAIIEQLAADMNPETDVLSVIGCSHGNTNIDNGNSLLALGRANRVKESFLFLGVEHDKVLEEGCWAPVLFNQMPKRGVVVSLKRRHNS